MSTDKQITPHPRAEVIKAWADGKTIQYALVEPSTNLEDPLGVWLDYAEKLIPPRVNWKEYEWRIKPEQKTGWINIYTDHDHSPEMGIIYPDKLYAIEGRDTTRECLACIEITYTEGEGLE